MAAPESVETTESTPKSTQKTITERTPGMTMLPLARVKRVIKEDKDIALINADATYCIAYATVNCGTSLNSNHHTDFYILGIIYGIPCYRSFFKC